MQIYEVLNYFDRSRYFVSANDLEEMLEIVDNDFLNKLKKIKDDEGQYDDLRNDKETRMEEIGYELIMEDASKPTIVRKDLEGDLNKFYF